MRASTLTPDGARTITTPADLAAEVARGFTLIELDEVSPDVLHALGIDRLHLLGRSPAEQTYDALFEVEQVEVVVPVAYGDTCRPQYVVATPRFLLVVRAEGGIALEDVGERVHWDVERPAMVAAYLFVELALRTFRASIREVRSVLDDLEEAMLERAHREHLLTLSAMHRRISSMRRALGEYGDAVTDANDVIETDAAFPQEVVALAGSHGAAVTTVLGTLAVVRDEAANAMDLYRSLAATRQGLVINRLTVISAVLMPLTVITGFYGMNFGWLTDHIEDPVSFWLLGVALPALVAVSVVAAMWRAGWLVVLESERSARRRERATDAGRPGRSP